jgi:hypothetical protein
MGNVSFARIFSRKENIMSKSQIYIGIDNGLTGGIVALSDHPGPPIGLWKMPTRNKSKGNEVNAYDIWEILCCYDPAKITVILETPMTGWGSHNKDSEGRQFKVSTQSIASMWDSYGAIRGVLESRGIRHHRITPQAWQKVMLVGCAKGDTKPAALAMAGRIWPGETWLATPRSTKPHGGLIDAALIAEYARRMNL